MSQEEKNQKLEIDFLWRDVNHIKDLCEQLDDVLDQTQVCVKNIQTILELHDGKLKEQDKDIRSILNLLESRRVEVLQQVEDINKRMNDLYGESGKVKEKLQSDAKDEVRIIVDKIESITKRITSLEKWKWILVGVFGVLSIIFQFMVNTEKITNFLQTLTK